MYQLEHPEYFYLLIILPIIWLIYAVFLMWKKKAQSQFANIDMLNKLIPDQSTFKSILKLALLSLGIIFMVISLVNPKLGTALKTVKRSGVDVVFAMDVSKSMLAEDVAPSRLEKAKLIVRNTIDKLGSDRVGIIIYAGSAYPLLPITTDYAAAKMFLDNAHPDMVSSQGTAIAEAIKLSQTFFDADEETNRYLFILSDGEDHETNAIQAARDAKSEAIKIYTIGIGTPNGGPIPISKIGGVKYKKDQEGNMVITQLHDDVLKEIATIGKGAYIDGNITKTSVDTLVDILNQSEKKEFETKEFSDFKDQFQWFIGLGLVLILLDVFLLEKKTAWISALNLFNEKKTTL